MESTPKRRCPRSCCKGKDYDPSHDETDVQVRRISRYNQEYYDFMESQNDRKSSSQQRTSSGGNPQAHASHLSLHSPNASVSNTRLHEVHHTVDTSTWHSALEQYYATQTDYRPGEWRPYNQDDFITLRLNIGRGTTCKVHLCQHVESKLVAVMKIMNKKRGKEAITEYNVHTVARDSPFLLRAIAAFRNDTNFYILLEYAPFRTLDDLTQMLKGLGSETAKLFALEIACGLDFLHSRNIMHRDVKPGNMFILASGHVVLGDFGSAFEIQGMATTNAPCGTYVTKPPEMWNKEVYDCSVDIWMFGISLYNIITNKWPILHPILEKHIGMVEKGKFVFTQDFSEMAEDFIKKLIQVNPQARPTAEDMMNHPYFDGLVEPYTAPYTPNELHQIFGNREDEELLLLN